ncbi:BAH and coiled-coil domain-containing protein [Actinidia chinensis var. chinensis]|uniref:BAH and coiled-coil domain-containing protein n=1 Tax=Actinidia chinensis var. chinensis TaxID=1590841 RepID=A0A2R6PUC1_ACTCC|nr:BAH and coiled-coil domain-containing protein [Actinidia chinensis var. chinensis]
MHGRGGENRKRIRHMWSVPTVAGDSVASTADSFCKDGREISVGDCALFKPPQDSPPFIGIIRWLTLDRENNLQLGVNWLYRPVEVKLGKSILRDAAPNEVFYSFHKDEIPAASLLHPCKVAFLPKGVELPSGISSFVCHRVYDIANRCLWWLTDQNYIDERQVEVDQLLSKTRVEMHATVQPDNRSPKPLNGPTSTSQLKPGADSLHSASSFPSHAKGKKRERADQGSEPFKRECSSKIDDGDSVQFKPESLLKSDISKITEKGGLVDSEGVEKLVQLMQSDGSKRKLELTSRSMLAGVIAATENFDCLSGFVQLKGLTVLDVWLQDVHKGKIGHDSPKDGDKSVEEFLFVLLCALDKLPVNLYALQMCNIGKSVNHLRSHKNLEIQKKARSLVDIWKKRVEAEMNVIDAKSGSTQAISWASRSRLSEVSHGGNQHPGVSSEVAMKRSVTQLYAPKPASVKAVQGEFTAKSTSSPPGPMKSALSPASGKHGQPRIVVGSTSDLPSTTVREERSSSSSQSHNSQSRSSDHAKTTAFSGKEDARSSTAGSISVNKMSGGVSRHRRSVNEFPGPAVPGGQRETGSSRSSSLHRISASEKLSESGVTGEKALDVPLAEGNSHKLIVKIPNRGRSLAQSDSGGSVEDPSIMTSRASSPVLSDKLDQYDRHSKDKSDANRVNTIFDVNTESWQSNDLNASDKGDGSPDAIPEQRSRAGEKGPKLAELSKAASSSSGNKLKSQNLLEGSFSSMNALIESCVKYSKAIAFLSAGDNVGMNLLASVAAEEMSKSDLISPIDSLHSNTHIVEDSCTVDTTKSKSSNVNDLAQEQSRSADGAVADGEQGVVSDNSYSWNELDTLSEQGSGDFSGDGKTTSSIPNGEGNECNSSNLQTSAEPCLEINVRSDELRATVSLAVSRASGTEKILDGEKGKQLHEKKTIASVNGIQDTKPMGSSSLLTEYIVKEASSSDAGERAAAAGSSSYESLESDGEKKNNLNQGLDDFKNTELTPPSVKVQSESLERNEELLHHSSSGSGKNLPPDNEEKLNGGKEDEMGTRSHVKRKIVHGTNSAVTNENLVLNGRSSAGSDQKSEGLESSVESKEVLEHSSGVVVLQTESAVCPTQEVKQHMRSRESKVSSREANGTKESASIVADAASFPAPGKLDRGAKLKFDLNEGFIVDDGKYTEPINFAGPGSSDFNPLPSPLTSVCTGLPASITVAAAAKGPFIPPEDLLRSKGELGWKGSAATSAFRPAEPRKVLEMPLGTTNTTLPNVTAGKQGRPLLDFDLNVPDERILEDMASRNSPEEVASTSDHISNRDFARNDLMGSVPIRSSGGLDFDLNRVDEANDLGQYPASSSCRLDALLLPVKSSSSRGFPNFEGRRDFDLNNGPVFDEASAGPSSFSHYGRSSMQSQPHFASLRLNNADIGTFSSWFTTGTAYPAVTIPSILADRGEQAFPIVATGGPSIMLGPASGGAPFNPDIYRGSVLSSSPSVPFPSTPFQCPVYPFGTTFPLPSANFAGGSTTYMDSSSGGRLFPAVNSQLLGPAAPVSTSQYPRPYVVTFPGCSNTIGVEDNRKGSRQGLDLNSGPGSLDVEGRDETSLLALRQLSVASSQLAEEQARMYNQMVGGSLKRKEPEGVWDAENFRHKQSSLQ